MDIPGFYYANTCPPYPALPPGTGPDLVLPKKDQQKRKYFRIQENHQVPASARDADGGGTGSAIISADEVRKRKKTARSHARESRLRKRRERELVWRAPILTHASTAATLGREVGLNTPSLPFYSSNMSTTMATSAVGVHASRSGGNAALLEKRAAVVLGGMRRNVLVEVNRWAMRFPVSCLVRDQKTGGMFVSLSQASNTSVLTYKPRKGSNTHPWRYGGSLESDTWSTENLSVVSSLSITPSRYLLATLFGSATGLGGRMKVGRLRDPEDVVDSAPGEGGGELIHDSTVCFSRPKESHWSSSPCPDPSITCFAIAASAGLLTLTATPHGSWHFDGVNSTAESTARDVRQVLAVDWMSPTVVVGGLRNSTVVLHDTRSRGAVVRLRHRNGIHSVRKVDEWRVVVAGWGNNMDMYDFRHPRNGNRKDDPLPSDDSDSLETQKYTPNNSSNKKSYRYTSTLPYLSFPEYTSNESKKHVCGIDISTELGVLASPSESNKIDLFSLRTGSRLTSPPITQYQYHQYPADNRIRCLRFEEGRSSGTPRLLVGVGSVVEEWAW